MKMRNWYRQYHLKTGQVITEFQQGVQEKEGEETGWENVTEEDTDFMTHLLIPGHPPIEVYDHESSVSWYISPDNIAAISQFMKIEEDPRMG